MSQQPPGPPYQPPGPAVPPGPQGQTGFPQPGQWPQYQAYPVPYGPPPGPVGPMGTVALTIQGSVLTSNMIVPSVTVNGYPIRTKYGLQDIPVPAGPVHIEAYAQWMRRYGQATLDFTLQPGRLVSVFYAAPMHQFTTGLIGHQPQKRKGLGVFIGVFTVIPLIVLLVVLLRMFVR